MQANVNLNYIKFPEIIESGVIKISEDQTIKLSVSEEHPNSIVIEISDNSFGAEYLNSFVLDLNESKDFYNIFYQLLKQISK